MLTGSEPNSEAHAPRWLAEFIFLTRSHGMHTPAMIASRQIRGSSSKRRAEPVRSSNRFSLFCAVMNSENSEGTASFHAVLSHL
jgi:hypothetical protein